MQAITEIITTALKTSPESHTFENEIERLQRQCDISNKKIGNLTGHNCSKCLNRGVIYVVGEDKSYPEIVVRTCSCSGVRQAKRNIERSGLSDLLTSCTFNAFTAKYDWQIKVKESAISYLDDNRGKWFAFCGQVGAGKTHICTAIVGQLLKRGIAARYMRWKDESTKLKAIVNDDSYSNEIEQWKSAPVLYIDDFFKVKSGLDKNGKHHQPSPGDVNVAFEILNHRYINQNLVTIISSEHSVKKILEYDEAVGSRIYQRSKEYCTVIEHDTSFNYRLYGS